MRIRGNRNFTIVVSVLLVVAVSSAIFLLSRAEFISASPDELFECNTLKYSSEGAIDLVFFGSELETKKYSDFLFDSEPFDELEDRFNVHYISEYVPECEIYRGVAFLCYSERTIRAAASCPNDYVIVLKNGPSSIRSSEYEGVVSINTAHALSVLLHELGHAIGNLAEEYAPAKIPRGSENCQSSCSGFSGEVDGCFRECSEGGYFRSIQAGVMRTLSIEDYGIFDDELMKTAILSQSNLPSSVTGRAISDSVDCAGQQFSYAVINPETGETVGVKRSVGCPPREKKQIERTIFTDAPGEVPDESGFEPIVGETFVVDNEVVAPVSSGESVVEIVNENEVIEKEIDASVVRILEPSIRSEIEEEIEREAAPQTYQLKRAVSAVVERTFGTSEKSLADSSGTFADKFLGGKEDDVDETLDDERPDNLSESEKELNK